MTYSEIRCLRRCAEGRTDAEIGDELGTTAAEIAATMSSALSKLQAPNRMAGLAKATRLGIIRIGRS